MSSVYRVRRLARILFVVAAHEVHHCFLPLPDFALCRRRIDCLGFFDGSWACRLTVARAPLVEELTDLCRWLLQRDDDLFVGESSTK